MHKAYLLLLSIGISFFLQAQHLVTVRIMKLPSYHKSNDTVYLTGGFNNWNPGQKDLAFKKDEKGNYFITLTAPAGKHEYKITRGNWDKVESNESGLPLNNRVVEVNGNTTIEISIQHWADHFPKKNKVSTASKNVRIIETAFYMPQLNRHRRIWIYLPESYSTSRKKYPVLYMHDGQNVFDDTTSFSGEWGVDETLDTLGKEVGESIVVAIDNGGDKRMNEYSPYDTVLSNNITSLKVEGEGDQYVDFIVNTLKPFIQKKYRIKKDRKYQFIAGSSMGGLISLYALLKYPKEFGGAGVFSPSLWIAPKLKDFIAQKAKNLRGNKIYFYAGKQEGEQLVPDVMAVFEQIRKISKAKMATVIRTEGKHNEATWRKEFPLFYKWIMQ